jgi:spore coat protein U-like protein
MFSPILALSELFFFAAVAIPWLSSHFFTSVYIFLPQLLVQHLCLVPAANKLTFGLFLTPHAFSISHWSLHLPPEEAAG